MSLKEKLKILDKLSENVNKKSGKKVMGRLADEDINSKMVIDYIPTPSIDLNEAVGGGFPKGKITTIAGMPDAGKCVA